MEALGLNFLEINPAGEFLWLTRNPGLSIHEVLADSLSGRAPRSLEPAHSPRLG